MRKNKKLKLILLTLFLVTISICGLFIVCNEVRSEMSYKEVRNLCNEIRSGNVEKSLELIEKSSDVNKTTYPPSMESFFTLIQCPSITTPLIEAVELGNIEIIEALLKKGADPNYSDSCGFTAIEKLYKTPKLQNYFEIAKLLIEYGADVNKTYDSWSYPIFDMVFRERDKITLMDHTRLLIENGAYVVDKRGYDFIGSFIDSPYLEECIDCILENTDYDINRIEPDGKTVLTDAVERQEVHAVEVLLSKGVDKTIKNSEGKTALDIANETGNVEIIHLLNE